MSYVRLNPGVYLETITTNCNQAVAANDGYDIAVNISTLKAKYNNVTISGCIEVNAWNYKQLSFVTSWIDGNYAYFTFRNSYNASLTIQWIRVTFICYGKK